MFLGIQVDYQLTHLKEVSSYNYNYYSYEGKILFAKSDDDNTTEWYLIKGDYPPVLVGYSYASDEPETIVEHN